MRAGGWGSFREDLFPAELGFLFNDPSQLHSNLLGTISFQKFTKDKNWLQKYILVSVKTTIK